MFFQIVTTFLLCLWPIVAMTSVMMFAAPGSTDNTSNIVTVIAVLFYPAILGAIYWLTGTAFWGLSAKTFFISTVALPLAASLYFRYPRLLLNSLRGISSVGYAVKEGKVFYKGIEIQAEAQTFKVLETETAKDANRVFYRGKVIEAADAESFSLFTDVSASFSKDKNRVYYEGKVIDGADAKAFKPLVFENTDYRQFFIDNDNVFLFNKKIADVDASSAALVSPNHLKDKSVVYFLDQKIEGADPETFQLVNFDASLSKDKNAVYFKYKKINGADPNTFQILDRGYVKDSQTVFYLYADEGAVALTGANAQAFHVTGYDQLTNTDANDGVRYYLQGQDKRR